MLDSALPAGGLTLSDIHMLACPLEEHLDCYESSDALVTFEPLSTKLLNQGAHLLFDSRMISDKIMDVLVVQKHIVNAYPNSLTQLLTGYFKARQTLSTNPDEAAKLISLRMQLTPAETLKTFQGIKLPTLEENHQLLSGIPSSLDRISESLSRFILDRKILEKSINHKPISNARFLPVMQK
jgi:NitT/TauT family transport system substrate-binding protein